MKKKIFFCLLLILSLFITVLFIINKDNVESISKINGLSLNIKKETLTNTSAIIVIENSSDKKYEYGEEFVIEKKVSGKWKRIKTLKKDIWWNAVSYQINENDKIEIECKWESIYGNLKSGKYRLVKIISNKRVAVEFEI